MTVWRYGQLPGLNPWQGGGLPDNPTPGYLSVQGIATFLFGAKLGTSVFLVTYLLVGTWGFFKLGECLYANDVTAAAFLAIIGPASPALAFHLAAGHTIIAGLLAWPAIFYYLLQAERESKAGFLAGLFFAISFNETPYYVAVYGGCILFVGWLVRMWSGAGPTRRTLVLFAARFSLVCVPIVMPTAIAISMTATAYQRVTNTPFSFSPAVLFSSYLTPATALAEYSVYFDSFRGWWGAWELKAYLGWGALVFWLAGLALGRRRWFHFALLATFIFVLGNLHVWEPMRWLMKVPPFSSHQSFNRLRLFVLMFFAMGAGWGFHCLLIRWHEAKLRRVVCLAAICSAFEIVFVSNRIVQNAHRAGLPSSVINEQGGTFYQRRERVERDPDPYGGWPADLSAYSRANVGIVAESAAIPSQYRDGVLKTAVLAAGSPGSAGEFSQDGRPVKPDFWSPNHIKFSGLRPNIPLRINLNRGNPWSNFDIPLFPNDRIVEFGQPFLVMPDRSGRIDLTYRLRYSGIFWTDTFLAGLGLLVVGVRCGYHRIQSFVFPLRIVK